MRRLTPLAAFLSMIAIPYVSSGQATIAVFAGSGSHVFTAPNGDGGQAKAAILNGPASIVFDPAGNLYIWENSGYRIRKVAPSGIITTYAGTGTVGSSGDGVPATTAKLGLGDQRGAMATDKLGNLYIVDATNYVIRKVDTTGKITTVAGTGQIGISAGGDGGPATKAALCAPSGIAVDGSGNIYFGSSACFGIRKVDPSGTISTVAKTAQFGACYLSAVDAAGTLYFASALVTSIIHKVNSDGSITTVAGNGNRVFTGDNGPAINASLSEVNGFSVDKSGNIFISDYGNGRIRRVDTSGTITTIAGGADAATSTANCPSVSTSPCPAIDLKFGPHDVTSDASGNVYTADFVTGHVFKISGIPSPAPPPPVTVGVVSKTVSAAAQQGGPFAAESIVIATGTHLATGSATGDLDQPPLTLAGTTVNVTDSAGVSRPAILITVSTNQVTYQIPPGTATGTATVTIMAGDGISATTQVQIAAVAPGLYTLTPDGLAKGYVLRISNGLEFIEDVYEIDANGTVIARPITVSNGDQVYLILYGTGFRAAGGDVGATVGGEMAPVLYAGPQGVQPGLDELNILVPPDLGTGTPQSVQIVFTAGGQAANSVTVMVQ